MARVKSLTYGQVLAIYEKNKKTLNQTEFADVIGCSSSFISGLKQDSKLKYVTPRIAYRIYCWFPSHTYKYLSPKNVSDLQKHLGIDIIVPFKRKLTSSKTTNLSDETIDKIADRVLEKLKAQFV